MPRKRFKTEEIIQKLREAEVLLSQGRNVSEACRQIGVTDNTYYRWRKEYGGIRSDQAKRLKELERENARLKKLVAEAALDKAILREAASGNFPVRRSVVGRWSTYVRLWVKALSRNVERVGFWVSPARRSVGLVMCRKMSLVWSGESSNWPPDTAGMDTFESQ